MSYESSAAVALAAIDRKGGTITVRSTRQAPVIPGTDRPSAPPTKLEATPKAVVLPVARRYLGSDVFGTGTLITESHRMALVAGPALPDWTPQQGDTIVAEGRTWKVLGTKTLKPDVSPEGVAVLHTIFFSA